MRRAMKWNCLKNKRNSDRFIAWKENVNEIPLSGCRSRGKRQTSEYAFDVAWRFQEKYRRVATILCARYNIFILYLYERNERAATIYLNHDYSRVQIERKYEDHGWIKHARLFFQFTRYKTIFALPDQFTNWNYSWNISYRSLVAIMTTSFMHSVIFVKRATILFILHYNLLQYKEPRGQ